MRGRILSFVGIAFLTIAAHQQAFAQAGRETRNPAQSPQINYTVSMPKPWTHLLEVEMNVRWNRMPASLDLKMPVWTPGSYLVREYSRHVEDFTAMGPAGRPLRWEKANKNTWRIATAGAREVTVRYNVYSNELTVRTNELNDEHAFWNNTALLMYPAGQLRSSSTIRVIPYGNWKVATGLRPAGSPNTYIASDYDVLYDSPFEVSNFKETTFNVRGKPHRFVVTGEGNYDLARIASDTAKIAEESVKIFGELPLDDYLFILNLRGGGGLEHLNSTALQWNRFGFKPESRYKAFLALVAHEYFHLWNVKRLRPDALGPFDYENENYTKLLWLAEGTTAYYEGVLLRRAGLISDREVLDTKATLISQLQNRPGRFETSLEESSFDAWIKYYRQDENAINNQISYYDKGEIVSMMLDITLRDASNGARSLDDLMRYLYNEFFKKGRNFTPADVERGAEIVAGRRLDDFFARYIRGRDEIDYNEILGKVGLRLVENAADNNNAYLGADLTEEGGRLMISRVAQGTPAYEQGLNNADQIVAIDGFRASNAFMQSYIGEKRPGDVVRLSIFRFDRLRDVTIKLGSNMNQTYSIVPVPQPTEQQRRLYRDMFQADLVR